MMVRPVAAVCAVACVIAVAPACAQVAGGDIYIKIDQLENQVRQLTGAVEQLQYRNQQLEATVRRLQEEVDQHSAARSSGQAGLPRAAVQPIAPMTPAPTAPGRRSDAFDPTHNPGAPGAPRTLGAVQSIIAPEELPAPADPPPAPGGRVAGAPLDLGSMSNATPVPRAGAAAVTSLGQPPRATGATAPPSQAPRDVYDLGYGYLLHKDYALAEDTFRDFLKRYPGDRLAAEAQYWLGESMFQRQNYRDAADTFLSLSKKFESSAKAPDSLLRLGQSLAALNEKELACATFGEVARKYPNASLTVKQVVEREQKRVRC
ncbi:MAG: tol-pal system protein YbgF [Xanthobacteraceae bacterium]|nr:tol-pal system protein YbgF [Xanthobacteraceae bacterium]